MKPLEFTDQNFREEVMQSSLPVVIDFWAVWCGPCKMIAPIMEELAQEYQGKAKIGKLDVDHNPTVAMQYGIRSIPTVMIFQNGDVVEQIVGAVPKRQIVEKLSSYILVN